MNKLKPIDAILVVIGVLLVLYLAGWIIYMEVEQLSRLLGG